MIHSLTRKHSAESKPVSMRTSGVARITGWIVALTTVLVPVFLGQRLP